MQSAALQCGFAAQSEGRGGRRIALAAVMRVIANALFLQAGRHPSPMFGSVVAIPAAALALANPLPRPRPVEAAASLSEPKAAETRPAEPKATDPLANLVKATSVPAVAPSNVARPPAPIPASSRNETIANPSPGLRRVAAVQRALTEYGYGQLKRPAPSAPTPRPRFRNSSASASSR
jgi:hypothetical protein